jgi:hypothetical protein
MSDSLDNDVINNLVQGMLDALPSKTKEGEVIIAVCRVVALVARTVGNNGTSNADEVLDDMMGLIEDIFEQHPEVLVGVSQH